MTLYKSLAASVSTASDFRIKVCIKHLSGAAVVVHQQGSITAVMPPR